MNEENFLRKIMHFSFVLNAVKNSPFEDRKYPKLAVLENYFIFVFSHYLTKCSSHDKIHGPGSSDLHNDIQISGTWSELAFHNLSHKVSLS